jgi:radical SAM superfamily enzyme with C-terminal helix-hairpin-helix motif
MAARPFENMLEVDELLATALDEAAREVLYGHLFLPLDLNNASDVEMKLIPGVGDRMAYEFDEYRPYDAIERFRREMGKYVDEEEVARLEKYVVIR